MHRCPGALVWEPTYPLTHRNRRPEAIAVFYKQWVRVVVARRAAATRA